MNSTLAKLVKPEKSLSTGYPFIGFAKLLPFSLEADGGWVAFTSDFGSQSGIYVNPFRALVYKFL